MVLAGAPFQAPLLCDPPWLLAVPGEIMRGLGPAESRPSRFGALKAGPVRANPSEGHLVLQELTGEKRRGLQT